MVDANQIKEYKQFVTTLTTLYNNNCKLVDLNNSNNEFYELTTLLINKLDKDEIKMIDKLVKGLYTRGIFAVLELVNEQIRNNRLKLISNDIELPIEPFGNGIEIDWIDMCEGKQWIDETNCPIHTVQLVVEEVPIIYGLIRYPSKYYELKKSQFPYANMFVEGGCMVCEEKYERVAYCVKCRESLILWNKENETNYGLS